MTYVATTPDPSEKIYFFTFDADEFDRILHRRQREVDIVMDGNGTCYCCSTVTGGKYNVSS